MVVVVAPGLVVDEAAVVVAPPAGACCRPGLRRMPSGSSSVSAAAAPAPKGLTDSWKTGPPLGWSRQSAADHGREAQGMAVVPSSVPATQSLGKVQVKRVKGSAKGLKGLSFAIMSQSCVWVRAGASVDL